MAVPVAVLGAGSFGSCLAMLSARSGATTVSLWARDADTALAINRDHRNPNYLTDLEIPPNVHATVDLEEALHDAELVIVAVPSHAVREVMGKAAAHIAEGAIIVSTVKGIEYETGLTMHGVLEEVLPEHLHPRIVCLSGPSFAREIAHEKATVVTLACAEENYAISVQDTLSGPWFRTYTNTDVIGVELGGALKNVIAIAVGMCDGLEAGDNARAALMTRGLAEITRLGTRLGAEPTTFLGLSGMGDLILTCAGELSRNRRVGLELGRGRALSDILDDMGEVAEGVGTTRAVCQLADRLGVELPIAETVRSVLDGERTPLEGGMRLMTRQLKSEREHHRS